MFNEYLLVFIGAAIPWFEIALVIPLGIVRGLSPFWVMLLAFVGNVSTVIPLVIGFEKVKMWYKKRHEKGERESSKRSERAKKVWNKYGLPGLAILGPILIGIHIATFIGMSFGAKQSWVFLWMISSLALWTIIFGVVTKLGFNLFL
ncbi:Putative small multi-drug export protein [Mesobacillus persicus]|uniref:Putative small multi-drug export protein n=1 Tax=Mesobacillus persicus TaxID=930146 RepID=A0A1H8I6K7_9BACI|nr:small multi-drug export protein [Mesobacillus persicus]SEN64460.1 Putative small multi-drug export protein [Mesobacillus persicus]